MIRFSPLISIYELNEDFETCEEVIWTFSKNLKGVSSQRKRFNIYLVNQKIDERKSLTGSIISIWKFFDQSQLREKSLSEKKVILLNLIKDSFNDVADDLGWDKHLICEAYNQSCRENIVFEYITKPVFNKSRTHKASIKLKLAGDKVLLYGVFWIEKQTEPKEILMIETFLMHIPWFRTFKNYKWINEDNFGFVFYNGLILSCSMVEMTPVWNKKETEEDLGFICYVTYRKFESQKEINEWMKKIYV